MGIWLGSNKGNPRKPLVFRWNSDAITILGYTYGAQYNPNTRTKLGKGKIKNPKGYTKVETFTTITHSKENINEPGNAK